MLSFLTTNDSVVILDNMKAQLLLDHKTVARNGAILQLKIWKVPESIPPTTHGFKYRLVYIRNGERVVGFDNERNKGDHMHLDGAEFPYHFRGIERLIEDFIAEVEKRRGQL